MYTDITRPYTPTASVPILLEIYIPKNMPILLRKREVKVSKRPLNRKTLILLKKITFIMYMTSRRKNVYKSLYKKSLHKTYKVTIKYNIEIKDTKSRQNALRKEW